MMALAREASGLFEILMEEKSQHLILEGDEEAQVEGDGLFLRQALVNIIHNAVKYSPVGENIALRVRRGDGNRVVVEIEDHGPGIPAEDQQRVFDRFYRVDGRSRWSESRRSGPGVIDRETGKCSSRRKYRVEERGNHGCTFRISLPTLLDPHRPE